MWADFLKTWRARRSGVYQGFYDKKKINMLHKTLHKNKRTNRNWAHLHPKNWLLKITRSKRHSNYHAFWKSRVASLTSPRRKQRANNTSFRRNDCPKGAFLKIPKILKGTKTQLFVKVRHWDPLKTFPGSGVEKTMKRQSENERFFIV